MIVYDLSCGNRHRFEGWFDNAEDFQHQSGAGLLTCPLCGSAEVSKLPSAGHLSRRLPDAAPAQPSSREPSLPDPSAEMLRQLHDYVEKHFDNVGSRFAEEARRIHYGEAEERNIRGAATHDEVESLHEEGIETLALPPAPVDKDRLN